MLVFFRESIFGYRDLRIQLYYTAGRLTTYFGITYSDRVTPEKYEGIQVRFGLVFHHIDC
jgi:histone acetyltransferase 1